MFNNLPTRIVTVISILLVAITVGAVGYKYAHNEGVPPVSATGESNDMTDNNTECSTTQKLVSTETRKDTQEVSTTTEKKTENTTKGKNITTTKTQTTQKSTTKKSVPYVDFISVVKAPSKTTYYVGDTFSASGLQVNAYFSDGTNKNVSSHVKYSSPDMYSSGYKSVEVSYTDSQGNKEYAYFGVTVNTPSVSLSNTSIYLTEGESEYIYASVDPSSSSVSWYSSSTSVARVDSYGRITAVGEGTASVYATIYYKGRTYYSDYCWIYVSEEVTTTNVDPQITFENIDFSGYSYSYTQYEEEMIVEMDIDGYIESNYILDYVWILFAGPVYEDGNIEYTHQTDYVYPGSYSFDLNDYPFEFSVVPGETYTLYIVAQDETGHSNQYQFDIQF